MIYEHFDEIPKLISDGLATKRNHPSYPLSVYNYTVKAQLMPPGEWTPALMDCRGLILDSEGIVVGRPFRKFWNYSQMLDKIPADEPFTAWEKLDGSLITVAAWEGRRVVASRGSFESEQAEWAERWLMANYPHFPHAQGWSTFKGKIRLVPEASWIFEAVYPNNRIVVDYKDRQELVLLDVKFPDGTSSYRLFIESPFARANKYEYTKEQLAHLDEQPEMQGQEGIVVKWAGGLMCKMKVAEYVRLHRLITQCSTRTIWELLRSGAGIAELIDRVPEEFKQWVTETARGLDDSQLNLIKSTYRLFDMRPVCDTRKDYAMWAKQQNNSSMLFALLDGREIGDMAWKIVEPQWETPFRGGVDAQSAI
jgi:RNA ligase